MTQHNAMNVTAPTDTRKLFWSLGTCSRTLYFILDRALGETDALLEKASEPLAGGLAKHGEQCGILWGAALAAGGAAASRCTDPARGAALAILTAQDLANAFVARAGHMDCRAIMRCDVTRTVDLLKAFLFGRFFACARLAEAWAPEAIQIVVDRVSGNIPDDGALSCAAEAVRRVCGSETAAGCETAAITAAGLAGGLGLSGGGCGALAAVIWHRTRDLLLAGPDTVTYPSTEAKRILTAFLAFTGGEIRCDRITGRRFKNPADHTAFLRDGGCNGLLTALTKTARDEKGTDHA